MVENTDSLNPSAALALTGGGKGQWAGGLVPSWFLAPSLAAGTPSAERQQELYFMGQ